jgi:hypothetical protein
MSPSSSPSPVAADQLENINIAAADAPPPTSKGTNQPRLCFLDLPTEIRLEIFKWVLVEDGKLYPHTTRHVWGEPTLETRPRGYLKSTAKYESKFVEPLVDILEVGLVAKPLLPIVREVFFGLNCFDLGTKQKWMRGIHPDLQVLIHDVEMSLTDFSSSAPRRHCVMDFFYIKLQIRRLHISIDDLGFEKLYKQYEKKPSWRVRTEPNENRGPREKLFRTSRMVRGLHLKRSTGKVTFDFTDNDQSSSPPTPGWLLAEAARLKHVIE